MNNLRPKKQLSRYSIIIVCIWTVIIIASFFTLRYESQKSMKILALTEASISQEKDFAYRRWAVSMGGIYVPVTEKNRTNPFLAHISDRDITASSGKQFTLIPPSLMSRMVYEREKENKRSVTGHLTSMLPLRAENSPDPWEARVLKLFEERKAEKAKSYSEFITENGQHLLRYMYPMIVNEQCLKCHDNQGYKLGDIRGGQNVNVQMGHFEERFNREVAFFGGSHFILWLLGIGVIAIGRGKLYEAIDQQHKSDLELESTRLQLVEQEKLASVGQLAAGVAHEINNPMGFISSNLRSLDRYVNRLTEFINVVDETLHEFDENMDKDQVENAKKRLKIEYVLEDSIQLISESLEGAERVRRIVQDLKDFSHLDQSEIVYVDLNEALETIISVARSELKHVSQINREFTTIPRVECHAQGLKQVFLNLILNAASALEGIEKSSITVRTETDGEYVITSITDNGCGMTEEVKSHIFEPFFTTRDVGKGVGLGLSRAFDIIKKHNGQIIVESIPSKGSTFTVRLPAVKI